MLESFKLEEDLDWKNLEKCNYIFYLMQNQEVKENSKKTQKCKQQEAANLKRTLRTNCRKPVSDINDMHPYSCLLCMKRQ